VTTLDNAPDVRQMAANLGLDWRLAPTDAIIDYCRNRIAGWVQTSPPIATLGELESMVCRHLRLVMEDFHTDEELDRLIARYVAKGEFVFAAQRDGFDSETFATLIRCDNATPVCPDQFVALIDCRGTKALRRYFTRWHEIAHVLTLVNGQMTLPFHRSRVRDPIEKLMDTIAAEIGFYQPIFAPAAAAVLCGYASLGFFGVDAVRSAVCPAASFEATLYAVIRHSDTPIVTIEAGLEFKNEERRMIEVPGLFPGLRPEPKLRVIKSSGNDAAKRAGLRIHNHMRVPESSVIAALFHNPLLGGPAGIAKAIENLADWSSSDGKTLRNRRVAVEAQRRGDHVIAIICPA